MASNEAAEALGFSIRFWTAPIPLMTNTELRLNFGPNESVVPGRGNPTLPADATRQSNASGGVRRSRDAFS